DHSVAVLVGAADHFAGVEAAGKTTTWISATGETTARKAAGSAETKTAARASAGEAATWKTTARIAAAGEPAAAIAAVAAAITAAITAAVVAALGPGCRRPDCDQQERSDELARAGACHEKIPENWGN